MQYRIALCDDASADRGYISALVRTWADREGHEVLVREFPSAESFLFAYEESDFDILLLDIEMGRMDGVTLAKKIRSGNETIQIIFVTGYSEYIEQGYEVAALHYLLKPLDREKLFAVLSRAAQRVAKNERVLLLESEGEMLRLPVYRIRFAQVHSNYVTIHAERDHVVRMTLGDLEKQLDSRFYRAGRSLIVNLTRISRVTKSDIHLNDGTMLPLPRGAYEGVNRAIISSS